jgi:hypothetical protein
LPLKKVDIFKGYAKFFNLNIPASFRLPWFPITCMYMRPMDWSNYETNSF